MFLPKVSCSFVSVFFFAIVLNNSFASIQDTHIISQADLEMNTEGMSANATKSGQSETTRKSLTTGKNPFVYRRQDFKESVEKIQTVDNGKVMKSTYIPIVSAELHDSHSRKQNDDKGSSKNDDPRKIGTTAPTNSTKENYIVKNGKTYKVVKVKKTFKNLNVNQPKNQMQRRTFKPLQNLMSFLPLKWMTRQWKNETESETRSENVTQWSKLSPVHNREENSKEILQHEVQNSEKIKKLLNLFTIVKFPNGECYAGGIKGTCLHQVECEASGGKFTASCAGELGVCCYWSSQGSKANFPYCLKTRVPHQIANYCKILLDEKTCGETSSEDTTFINEGFPDSSTVAPKVCTLTLEKANSDVKQLRLDFEIFQLREPTNGTCLHDRLVISGQDVNHVVPEICGSNTGQHIYLDVEESDGPFNLNVIAIGDYFRRNFRIKVTQVKKGDELFAPKNCLQYYGESTGYVQTFNYQHEINENLEEIENGYFNNLNYAICIKKHKGFCSITYENEELYGTHPTFHLINTDEDGAKLLPPGQAGAESFDCPDDYIIINGIRLCGEKLNDASIDIDYTRNYPVTDTTNGPFIIYVRTDAAVSGRGFNLKYTEHPCLT